MNDPREFHRDTFLENLIVAFRPEGFIADQVFPRVQVAKQSNAYAVIPKDNWFRADDAKRAPGTLANEVGYTVGSATYFADNYELRHKIVWETLDNADPPWVPLRTGAQLLVTKHELGFEIRVEAVVAAGVGSVTTLTAGNIWSAYATSDPLTDLEVAANAIQSTTGKEPNVAIIPRRVWQVLRRHPDIVQRVFPGGAGGGTVSQQQFGDLIGVDKILVPRTIKNTANEGAAAAMTAVWSTNVYLAHVAPNPSGDMVATLGLAFNWTGPNIGGNGPTPRSVERKRDEDIKADWLRVGYYQDEKIVSPELGFQIRTGITT